MRFDRCLVTNSISGPSRACILTGKYSHKNGFRANEATPFDSSQQTFPKLLQKAGYQTAIIGKWHLDSQPMGFDYWEVLPGQGNYYNPDFMTTEGRKQDTGYVTELITEKALSWLKNVKDSRKPFMLMVHHKAPHRGWRPGPGELGLYFDTEFPEPSTLFDDYAGRGHAEHEQDMTIAETMRMGEDLKMWDDSTKLISLRRLAETQLQSWNKVYDPVRHELFASDLAGTDLVRWKYQRYMQDYLACIAAVDKGVGRILDYLEENGMDKNTLIVYTSDQGFYLGEHGWFDKRFMFEESYRTPLLISWKGTITGGSNNTDIVSNLDFAETFLDAAGIDIPEDMQGESLLPVLKGNTPENWRKAHYYHYYGYPDWHSVKRHYGVSTARYKLIHFYYDIDEWELFDLKKDPQEMRNVFNDPAYAKVKEMMHHKLDSVMMYYEDSDSLAYSYLP
jgi:arylsulfatase A-like enzyme